MSNRKELVSGRRESLPAAQDEAFCQNAFQQIKETISDLEDQLIAATDLDTIASLQFDITEYRKRQAIVTEVLTELQGYQDYADDQYFQYIAKINTNANTIETVAQYLAIDIQELARNSQQFLEVMRHDRLLKIAAQTTEKVEKTEALKTELNKAHTQIETLKRSNKEQNDLISRYIVLISTLNEELQKKNQAIEESQQMLRDALEQREQIRSMYEREVRERDETISLYESQNKALSDAKEQQDFVINQIIELWRQQQAAIRQEKHPIAHKEYGILLATAVQAMEQDFAQHKLRDRSAHALRTYLQELINAGKRDYTSSACKQAIAECNQYLRGTHPGQADLEAVFQNPAFYSQTTAFPLEETVLAFDAEGQQWWWLKYVFLLLKKEPSHEIAKSIRRVIRQAPDISHKPEFSAFLEHYQVNTALQEAVQTAFNDSFDKREHTGIG